MSEIVMKLKIPIPIPMGMSQKLIVRDSDSDRLLKTRKFRNFVSPGEYLDCDI